MEESTNQPSNNELAQERTEFAKFRTRQAADSNPNGMDTNFPISD